MKKFFTIIIPVYNPDKLEVALDSIEHQDIKDELEVILVNDCGSKDFESLLPQYSFEYKVITNKVNLGQGMARQIGLNEATGEWITFLDHDDSFVDNALTRVKECIINSKCKFVFCTKMIIANDYNWINTDEYVVLDPKCTLHGQFYNKEKLDKYNIGFNSVVRPHEDTYFLSLVEGNLFMDTEDYDETTSKIESGLITYCWYLWGDSTSHKEVKYKDINVTYLESTMKEYLWVNLESFCIIYNKYKDTSMSDAFIYGRLISLLFYIYWFQQYFNYIHYDGNIVIENLDYEKEAVDKIMVMLGINSIDELINLLLDSPDWYHQTYQCMLGNTDCNFVPKQSIIQFFKEL